MTPTDEQIKKHIIDYLRNETRVDVSNIAVKVKGGVVELTGNVSSAFARATAEMHANKIPQISSVRNFIVIGKSPPENYLSHVS